jgi:hypothetical protein
VTHSNVLSPCLVPNKVRFSWGFVWGSTEQPCIIEQGNTVCMQPFASTANPTFVGFSTFTSHLHSGGFFARKSPLSGASSQIPKMNRASEERNTRQARSATRGRRGARHEASEERNTGQARSATRGRRGARHEASEERNTRQARSATRGRRGARHEASAESQDSDRVDNPGFVFVLPHCALIFMFKS